MSLFSENYENWIKCIFWGSFNHK